VLDGILARIIDASLLRKAMQSCSGVDTGAATITDRSDEVAELSSASSNGISNDPTP